MEATQWAADAYLQACRLELEAFKPGNVSVHADGHDMCAEDFILSARYSAGPLTDFKMRLGQRIYEAVKNTRQSVGCNTNLGVILLTAPLLEAFVNQQTKQSLRASLQHVLNSCTVEDADWCFKAIRLASPGGLGESDHHDVNKPPVVGLLEAMRTAAERDQIALQYTSGYADIFEFALPLLTDNTHANVRAIIEDVYLAILARWPDTHVARKFGLDKAREISRQAASLREQLKECRTEKQRNVLLRRADKAFKQAGINPGTSADLTVATLLTWQLISHQTFPVAHGDGIESQTFQSANFQQPQSQSQEIIYGY